MGTQATPDDIRDKDILAVVVASRVIHTYQTEFITLTTCKVIFKVELLLS